MPPGRKPSLLKAAAPKKTAKRATKSRRRSPYELVTELKKKRDALMDSMGARIGKLDERIEALEAKHQARIAVSQLVESRSTEELAQDEARLKAQLAIMKKARKLSVTK